MATSKKTAAKKPAEKKAPAAKAEPKRVVTRTEPAVDTDKVKVMQKGEDTPEAQPTLKEKTAAANRLFEKADEAGKAEILAERRVTMAALGR